MVCGTDALIRADASGLALHLGNALNAAAMRAHWTFRPDASFDESVSGFFFVEMRGGKSAGDAS
jgi:hypothetical protein